MVEYSLENVIQLSAIQHLAFCERQCYLIHVEQIWEENAFTISGDIAHERVDSEETSYTKEGVKQVRSLMLSSRKYGLSGRADLVEFDEKRGVVYPVEYKIGKPKQENCDLVQLCSQAFCLEEMLNISIHQGAIYYGKTSQRVCVEFDNALRKETERLIRRIQDLYHLEVPPPVSVPFDKCKNCSLKDLCIPELPKLPSPFLYLHKIFEED